MRLCPYTTVKKQGSVADKVSDKNVRSPIYTAVGGIEKSSQGLMFGLTQLAN